MKGQSRVLPAFILQFVIIIIIFVRTITFGAFQWKNKNKAGAVGVFIFALVELSFPFYMLFVKEF